jgi:hypothetical protein
MPPKKNECSCARRVAFVATVLLTLSGGVRGASPSPPWMPGAAACHAPALLADEASLELPVTQWPLPRGAVARALDALPSALPPALDAARSRVLAELRAAHGPALSLTLRGHDEALAGFGDDATPGSSFGLRSATLTAPGLALQFGARLDDEAGGHERGRLDDTALATLVLGAQLQAFAHRHWWGPGWQDSLILGNNAPPLAGIGLQRASAGRSTSRWLAWMGPWSYDFFVAQADDALDAYVVGTRVTLRPLEGLEIGLTRTAQWGGRGRPQSPDSFLRLLLGIGVNPNTPQEVAADPGNEMAGIDARMRCARALPCAFYAQLTGEDATHYRPSRFLGLYGVEAWSADGRQRWFAEYTETLCGAVLEHNPLRPCAYRNHAYPDGYTHGTRWMGAAIGPDSRVATLGWLDAQSGTSLRLHAGRIGARIGVFAAADDLQHAGRLTGLGARQSWRWGAATLGAEVDWLRIAAAQATDHEARLGISLRVGLD